MSEQKNNKPSKEGFIKYVKSSLPMGMKVTDSEMEEIALIYFFDSEEEMKKRIG